MRTSPKNLVELILRPRNQGPLEDADVVGEASVHGRPPMTHMYLQIEDGRVVVAKFTSIGCGVSTACASMLTELVVDKLLEACEALQEGDLIRTLGGLPIGKEYCAGLAIHALHDAIKRYRINANPTKR